VVSNEGTGESPFAKLFSWEGTKDYGGFLSLTAAKEWRATVGEDDIIDYLHDLVSTCVLTLANDRSLRSFLVNSETLSLLPAGDDGG